jgi:hypothetical protein
MEFAERYRWVHEQLRKRLHRLLYFVLLEQHLALRRLQRTALGQFLLLK